MMSLKQLHGRLFKKGTAAQAVFTLSSGVVFSQVVSYTLSPVISRLYSPAEIGVWALFLNIVAFLTPLVPFQMDHALLVAKTSPEARTLVALNWLLSAGSMVLVMGAIGVVKATMASSLDQLPNLFLFFIPGFVGLAVCYRVLTVVALREQKFGSLSLAGSFSHFACMGSRVGLGFFGAGFGGLAISEFVYYLGSPIALYRLIGREAKNLFSFKHRVPYLEALKTYKSFWRFGQLSALVTALLVALPLQYVALLYSSAQIGLYAFALGLVGSAQRSLGHAVTSIFASRFAQHYRAGDVISAKRVYWRTLRSGLKVGIPLTIAGMLLAPQLFAIIFGQAWAGAGDIVQALMPGFLVVLVTGPVSQILVISSRQKIKLAFELLQVLLIVAIYFLAKTTHLELIQFVWIWTGAQVFSNLLLMMVINYQLPKLLVEKPNPTPV